MFTGEFEHSLDDKGRLILPSRFRGRLEQLVVTQGSDRCLNVYPPDEFNRISEVLKGAQSRGRDAVRLFYSTAHEDTLDKQGRVGIPETLRRYAGLDREVTVIGAGPKVEVWDRRAWAERKEQSTAQLTRIVEELDLPI